MRKNITETNRIGNVFNFNKSSFEIVEGGLTPDKSGLS